MKKCLEFPKKKRFNTKREAETALLIHNNKNLDIYQCLACHGWHLTSKESK